MEWIIETKGLTKTFGYLRALNGVDLKVAKGEFLTLVGPNGAGKSTLLRILATLSKPTSGTVQVAGLDMSDDSTGIRRQIGVVLHQTLLYDALTVEQNLRFYGRMYDVRHLEERINDVLHWVRLENRREDIVRTLSRGMQQRLAIARALLHDPPIMLLDEPDTGLDPQTSAGLKEILRGMGGNQRTVLMTTHNLDRGLQICDRVAILSKGRVVYGESKTHIDVDNFQQIYHESTGVRD